VRGTSPELLFWKKERLVIEEQVTYAFPDGRFVSCDVDVIVFDSKLRSSLWEGPPTSCRLVSLASPGAKGAFLYAFPVCYQISAKTPG